jgi:hypothetical protein
MRRRCGGLRWVACFCVLTLSVPGGGADFTRGDVDASGSLNVTDAVQILRHLFLGVPEKLPCDDAADVDDGGSVNLTDAVFLLDSLFRGGAAPVQPFPECGPDPSEDALSCDTFEGCMGTMEFCGSTLMADGFFFAVDRSPSWYGLDTAKADMLRVISSLPGRCEFGVVFFDAGMTKFPADGTPAPATVEMKEAAAAFIEPKVAGQGSCPKQGLQLALDMAKASTARQKVIVYIGDGGGTCQGQEERVYLQDTLDLVASSNAGMARVYALCPEIPEATQLKFVIDLAAQNGGEHCQTFP